MCLPLLGGGMHLWLGPSSCDSFLSLNEKMLLRVQNVVVLFSSVFSCDGSSHGRMNYPSFPSVQTPHIPLDTVWSHILLDEPSHHLNHNLNKLVLSMCTTVGAWA